MGLDLISGWTFFKQTMKFAGRNKEKHSSTPAPLKDRTAALSAVVSTAVSPKLENSLSSKFNAVLEKKKEANNKKKQLIYAGLAVAAVAAVVFLAYQYSSPSPAWMPPAQSPLPQPPTANMPSKASSTSKAPKVSPPVTTASPRAGLKTTSKAPKVSQLVTTAVSSPAVADGKRSSITARVSDLSTLLELLGSNVIALADLFGSNILTQLELLGSNVIFDVPDATRNYSIITAVMLVSVLFFFSYLVSGKVREYQKYKKYIDNKLTEQARLSQRYRERDFNPLTRAEIRVINTQFQRNGGGIHIRDALTKEAMVRLWRHQGPLSHKEIMKGVAEFRAYVKATNPPEKKKILRALDGPSEEFPPFLGVQSIWSVAGLPLIGEEVIGRLWIFTNDLDGNNRNNARLGMLGGLATSVNEWGLVCNPGKMQRIFQGGLQGYLHGVNLDPPVPTPPNEALVLFLQAYAESDNVADLEAAASIWLLANDSVEDEVGFFRELDAYFAITYSYLNPSKAELAVAAIARFPQIPNQNQESHLTDLLEPMQTTVVTEADYMVAAHARLLYSPRIANETEFFRHIEESAHVVVTNPGRPTRVELIEASNRFIANHANDDDFNEEKRAALQQSITNYANDRLLV